MTLTRCTACGLHGIDGYLVDVEVHRIEAAGGGGRTTVVGLPDHAVREAIDRVIPALTNAGVRHRAQDQLTINLAPAARRKEGPAFDLAIALGIASSVADNDLQRDLRMVVCHAELALDGRLRPVTGTLSAAIAAQAANLPYLVVAPENIAEALAAKGPKVVSATTLRELIALIKSGLDQAPEAEAAEPAPTASGEPDIADVRGHAFAKRALTIAAAGAHNLLMLGPPGSGKTMLARRLPGLLPALTRNEALDVTRIHSIAGITEAAAGLASQRPFRAPHHSVSAVGLVGGGSTPMPGDISLAHHGVLFLDELPEFPRQVLEHLRQPLEDGHLTISRAGGRVSFPSRCMLVAAMNPCPCGYLGHPTRRCTDNDAQIHRYRSRISGPLIDRIDLHVEVPAQKPQALDQEDSGPDTATLRQHVVKARERMLARQGCANADLQGRRLRQATTLPATARDLLHRAVDELGLSARAHDRILKVARTIADLDCCELDVPQISEAIGYRLLDRQRW